jgi:hypothetical protein
MGWKIETRQPGPLGLKRDEIKAQLEKKFGKEGQEWKFSWVWTEDFIDFEEACKVYEESYFVDSHHREALWKTLLRVAKDVYDIEPRDVESHLDYRIQRAAGDHLQDIAIRNVIRRRGWEFQGTELVQIRLDRPYPQSETELLSSELNPGKVRFHQPQMIQPIIPRPGYLKEVWWDKYSVEAFYQGNRVLLVKD